jgi:hypothetical protein
VNNTIVNIKNRYCEENPRRRRQIVTSQEDHATSKVHRKTEIVKRNNIFPIHTIKAYKGSGGVAPIILNLVGRWK